jgi:hypothetical protein
MNLKKEIIYNYLSACHQQVGGYTGKDIDKISKEFGVKQKNSKAKCRELVQN